MSKIDYTCEHDDAPRALYLVTMHDGGKAVCSYCSGCAELARMDWNGETKSCEPLIVDSPYDRAGTPGRACTHCGTAWPATESDAATWHHDRGCPMLPSDDDIIADAIGREVMS